MAFHTITICNHKGGVGKTATTVNLGHALALRGKRVLIVDMDPQGNSTQTLLGGMDGHPTNVVGLFTDKERRVSNSFVDTAIPDLKIVPASYEMFLLERQLPDTKRVTGITAKLGPEVDELFDLVIFDTPPNIGTFQVNALVASSHYIVPIQADSYYALSGMEVLFRSNQIIQEDANPRLAMLRVLLTLYDTRTAISKAMAEKIRSTFPEKVFETVIHRSASLVYSAVEGKTVFQLDPKSTGSKDYSLLAKELMTILGESHE